jgi:chromosome segregation ATPase
MSATTIEDQLAEIRSRINRLRARKDASAAERARIQRHVAVLHQGEASVRDAVRDAPDEVEERLGQLWTRLDVAENSVVADMSGDWGSFAAAVELELRSWDVYLERLQTRVAAKAWRAREQAEAAIGDVRGRRIEVDERLARARNSSDHAPEDARQRVTAARDKLEQKADDLSAAIK